MLTVYNVLKDLKDSALTFSAVAKRYSLFASSVSFILTEASSFQDLFCLMSLFSKCLKTTTFVSWTIIAIKWVLMLISHYQEKADLIYNFYAIPLEERKKSNIFSLICGSYVNLHITAITSRNYINQPLNILHYIHKITNPFIRKIHYNIYLSSNISFK